MATAIAANGFLKTDLDEIRRALGVLFEPGDVVETRAFLTRRNTISGYYADLEKLAQDVQRINRRAKGVYVTLNRIDPALLARWNNRHEDYAETTTADQQVTRRRWLPIDLDPSRPAGISASNAEHDAAIELAETIRRYLMGELGWPEPVLADSGNGAHLLFRIDLPNDKDATEAVRGCLQALDAEFSTSAVKVDTGNFNAARIWKLYGTVARKGDHTEDRPHRHARLLHVPETVEIVSGEKLKTLAAMAPKASSGPKTPREKCSGTGTNGRLDVGEWIAQHGIATKYESDYSGILGRGRKWILERCPWNPEHNDKSAFVIQFDNGAISAGCKHNTCGGKNWQDLRDVVEPGWRDRRVSEPRPMEHADDRAGDPVKFRAFTCAELLQTKFELRYLIDRVLVAGQPCILAGPKKTLKTTLLIDLALSVAMGGRFLGKWPVPVAARVGLMTGESGLATIQETIRRVSRTAGWDPAGILNLIVTDRLPLFANPEHEVGLTEFIEGHDLGVLIIDAAYLCIADADHGNLFDMGAKLRRVSELCQARDVTLILAHHTRKGGKADRYGPPELEDIAWAGFQEFARQWILLNRRKPYTPGTGQHRLWFAVGGSAGHGCLKRVDIEEGNPFADGGRFWKVAVLEPETEQDRQTRQEAKKEAERRARLDRDKRAIRNAVAKCPDGEVKTAIQAAAGLHSSRFGPAFAELVAAGDLAPCEILRRNRKRPYAGYRLGGTE